MWDTISRAELEATKKQLRTRRQELIRRHAEELQAIEQDQAEIEAFDQLIGTIADKFKIGRSRRNELGGGETGLQTEVLGACLFLLRKRRNRDFAN
jgi:chromosome segregation ATPase